MAQTIDTHCTAAIFISISLSPLASLLIIFKLIFSVLVLEHVRKFLLRLVNAFLLSRPACSLRLLYTLSSNLFLCCVSKNWLLGEIFAVEKGKNFTFMLMHMSRVAERGADGGIYIIHRQSRSFLTKFMHENYFESSLRFVKSRELCSRSLVLQEVLQMALPFNFRHRESSWWNLVDDYDGVCA